MMPNRTADRNAAMDAVALAAPAVFRYRKHSRSKQKFMDYEIAVPHKLKRPGTSFALLPNVRLLRAVCANAAPGERKAVMLANVTVLSVLFGCAPGILIAYLCWRISSAAAQW
jgi:hypothetical protein